MEELVSDAKEGNKEAYAKLALDIKDELFNIARKRIKNEDDINDIVQDTLIIGYLKINQLRHNKYFKTWIIKILINKCNKYYKEKERYGQLSEKYINNLDVIDNFQESEEIGFENLIKELDEIEKKIFKLYYQENYSIEKISKELKINPNTIKTEMYRGKRKISETYKKMVLFILIIGILVTGVTFGKDIINYLKSIFDLSSLGQNNDGILNAIEYKNWIQNVDMEYIDLENGYYLRINYLIVDEVNIYVVFELKSDNDISGFDRISITDLRLMNDKSKLIYDDGIVSDEMYGKISGWKKIDKTENEIQELFYIFSNDFPDINTLAFDFSEIVIYNDRKPEHNLKVNIEPVEFCIKLDEKFINQSKKVYDIQYEKNDNNIIIDKAIITETGFYAIVKSNIHKLELRLYTNNFSYMCERTLLYVNPEKKEYQFLIYTPLEDTSIEEMVLKDKNTICNLKLK